MRRATTRLLGAIELVLDLLLGPVDLLFEALFLIPLLGPLVFHALNFPIAVIWRGAALPLLVLARLGVRMDPRLAVRAIVLTRGGKPVAPVEGVAQCLAEASAILQQQTGVRLVPIRFACSVRPPLPLVEVSPYEANERALLYSCDMSAVRDDLLRQGGSGWYRRFIFRDAWRSFFGGARRLLFIGRPLYLFVIDEVKGLSGCSLGPLADYVVVGADAGGITMAHEIGHACGLAHTASEANLMRPRHCGHGLTRFQADLLFTSEHVTPF